MTCTSRKRRAEDRIRRLDHELELMKINYESEKRIAEMHREFADFWFERHSFLVEDMRKRTEECLMYKRAYQEWKAAYESLSMKRRRRWGLAA